MTWFKSTRTWISIIAGTCAVVLAIVCYSLHSDLARARHKSEKFDEFCSYVRTSVVMAELSLRRPITSGVRDSERDQYMENYFVLGRFGNRDRSDVELCATSPIDFHGIRQHFNRCTSDKSSCLAESFDEVLGHLPTRSELER